MSMDGGSGTRRFRRKRRANAEAPRSHSHRVTVTAEEEARLVLMAEKAGVTVPRLLIESAFSGDSETATERRVRTGELFGLARLLGRVSLNINQLAKVANATRSVPPETGPALDAVRRVAERIEAQLEESGTR